MNRVWWGDEPPKWRRPPKPYRPPGSEKRRPSLVELLEWARLKLRD